MSQSKCKSTRLAYQAMSEPFLVSCKSLNGAADSVVAKQLVAGILATFLRQVHSPQTIRENLEKTGLYLTPEALSLQGL